MRLWLTVSLVSVLLLAAVAYSQLPGVRLPGTFPIDPPTPYFHYLPIGTERGRVLVIHGLDANKEMMNVLCYALAEAGFDVYSIDLPGHGDSTVGFNAERARDAVAAVLDVLGPNTTVAGHSLGGALLLDLAADRSFNQMVLFSPAPTPVDRIQVKRLLVFTGQFDLPRIPAFIPQLITASAESVEFRIVPWAGHSGYLVEPKPIRDTVAWLGGNIAELSTERRLGLLISIILLALGIGILWLPGSAIPRETINTPYVVLSYIASSAISLFISALVVVLQGLRLFTTDYLISFVFLLGVTRLPACLGKVSVHYRKILGNLFAAAFVITLAILAGSQLLHFTLSGGRWWRFIGIAIAVLPLSIADEVLLRPMRPWWKAAGIATLTRILVAAFVVIGVLTMNRTDAFLVLITHFVVLFWIGLWFAGELLRRCTQDPLATAVFTAVVQAWFFAAIFVRT